MGGKKKLLLVFLYLTFTGALSNDEGEMGEKCSKEKIKDCETTGRKCVIDSSGTEPKEKCEGCLLDNFKEKGGKCVLEKCSKEKIKDCETTGRKCVIDISGTEAEEKCEGCLLDNFKEEGGICVLETCVNGGTVECEGRYKTCKDNVGSTHDEKKPGYHCEACLEGYQPEEGNTEICVPKTCANGGSDVCKGLHKSCRDNIGTEPKDTGYSCGACLADYEPDKKNDTICVPKLPTYDECRKNCSNGRCVKEVGGYKCECNVGYEGKKCNDISWCITNKESVCGNVECAFDSAIKSGYCKCPADKPHFEAKNKCGTIDKCSWMMAKGECRKPGQSCESGDCKCPTNFKYSNGDCIANACEENPCGNNGICKETGDGTHQCTCKNNYMFGDDGSCIKPNLCSPGFSRCEQTCNKTDGVCGCFSGFNLKSDKATCEKQPEKKECDKNCGAGKCIDDNCKCPEVTHVLKDSNCTDRCSANQLIPGTCPENIGCKTNKEHGFVCDCKGIYKQATDGVHCERKSMCSEGDGDLECKKKNGDCVEKYGDTNIGYECNCFSEEFTKNDKDVCIHKCSDPVKVRECVDILGVCELDSNFEAVCKCRPFMAKDKNGKCTKRAENTYTGSFFLPKRFYEKSPNKYGKIVKRSISHHIDLFGLKADLQNSLEKIFSGELLEMNLLNCREQDKYLNCSVELQMASDFSEKLTLLSTPTVCNKIEGDSSNCLIPPRLVKKKVKTDFKKTNPCIDDVKDKLCGYSTKCAFFTDNNFNCTCKDGFKPIGHYYPTGDKKSLIENCQDINECKNATICPKTTDCVNVFGSYLCTCKDGFRKNDNGDDPKLKGCIAVCDPNPCGKYGVCHQTGQHGFACNCTGTHTGVKCDIPNPVLIDAKDKGTKTASIIGGVLGAALVVMLIIGVVIYKRKKGKAMSDTEEYSHHRKQGILSDMQRRLGRNEQSRDIEIHSTSPPQRRGSGDYRREFRESDLSIPRPQVKREDSGDPRARDGRRPLARTSDNDRKSSVMQYRNRGFEED